MAPQAGPAPLQPLTLTISLYALKLPFVRYLSTDHRASSHGPTNEKLMFAQLTNRYAP